MHKNERSKNAIRFKNSADNCNITKEHDSLKKTDIRNLTIVSLIILLSVLLFAIFMILFHPGQFDKEIYDTVDKIQAADFTLIIYTDIHYDPHKKEPSTLVPMCSTISRIINGARRKGVSIDAFWNLGDMINGHGTTKKEAIEEIRTVIKKQNEVSPDFHNIMGNHDNNIHATWNNPPLPETEILTTEEVNNEFANHKTKQIEHHNKMRLTDYYVDFDSLRIICLSADDTTYKAETADWLCNNALQTNKEVLILSHIPTRPEWGFRNDIVNGEIIESALNEFVAKGGTIIAYIHGHDHGDMINDTGKWKEIAIGCARFQYPTSNGTEGMKYWQRNEEDETMLLFDIVSIDQETREVRFTRFGAGEDRIINY